MLDGGSAGRKDDGGEVVREDDAAERHGGLGEADLLPGEEVDEQEPRGVVVDGGRDEVAVRVEDGASDDGQVIGPGEAEPVEAAERGVEERLGEVGEELDEEERGLGGEDLAERRKEGAVGAAGGAQGEEVLEGGQAGGDV